MLLAQSIHPRPGPAGPATLAATTNLVKPELRHFRDELFEPSEVTWYRVVLKPAPDDTGEPAARSATRGMTAATQLFLDGSERSTHPLGNRLSLQYEPLPSAGLATDVSKSQEVERFTPSPALPFAFCRTLTAELDQSSFLRVKR